MQVVLAKTAGFCMGVRRALNIVLETINQKKSSEEVVFTLGPLIHNQQVVELLDSRGVKVLKSASELDQYKDKPCRVIIRSHGISPSVRRELFESNAKIIDATCPRVARVQSIIKRYYNNDFGIVIIGDKGHAEVEGLLGFSENKGHVVSSVEEAESLPDYEKVCVVGQTTQDKQFFDKVADVLKKRYRQIEIFDTICDATSMHQNELKELAGTSDAVVVVGGKNSANTARLANLAKEQGAPTAHIESSREITDEMVLPYDNISVTAGASTPNWIFLDVVERITEIQKKKHNLLKRFFMSSGEAILNSNIFIALGAVSLTYTGCMIQQIRPRFLYLLMAFLYVLSMHVLNQFTEHDIVGFNYPAKNRFYERNRVLLLFTGVVSGIGSLILSLDLGILTFILLLLATFLGIFYQVKIVPDKYLKYLKYQRLKDIPASKDFFIASAWGLVIVVFPFIGSRGKLEFETVIAFLFCYILVFIRSVMYGIKEVQGDRMVGRETLPIILGEKKSRIFIQILTFILAGIILLYTVKVNLLIGMALLITPIYMLFCILFYNNFIFKRNMFEIMIDLSFFLTGIFLFLIN